MNKKQRRTRRQKRIRQHLSGTTEKPRLCVYRSNKHVYAQLIDDSKGETILGVSESHITDKTKESGRITIGKKLGQLLAEKAKQQKITTVVFDRRGYAYHGIVKALAEGAREGGLKF